MAITFTNVLNLTLLELGVYARKSRMVIYHISKTEDKLKLLAELSRAKRAAEHHG